MDNDVISRILEKGADLDNELTSFLDDGVSSILKERRDPYFTIAKQKIKRIITHGDSSASVEYTNTMIKRLLQLESHVDVDTIDYTFVEICLEHVRDKNMLSRQALVLLNDIYKSIYR